MSDVIEQRLRGDGLFESQIEFRGKYCDYIKYLKEDIKVFSTNKEAYVISTIIGFLEGKKGEIDNDRNNTTTSILSSDLVKRRNDLIFIYRIIMLLEGQEDNNVSIQECKDRAFKNDPEQHQDIIRENMKLFHSYTCGGLEYLYNYFKMENLDNTSEKISRMYNLFYEKAILFGLIYDQEINSIIHHI